MLKQQFEDVLADFSAILGTTVALDADGSASFMVDDDIVVDILYLESSDSIVAFAPAGAFNPEEPDAGKKAMELLRMSEVDGPACGCTLALDEDAQLVLAMDRRDAKEIASADSLAAWIEALTQAVRNVRSRFAEVFPVKEV